MDAADATVTVTVRVVQPTRVVYDGLAKGTHTWCYAETRCEHRVCPDHGVQQVKRARKNDEPRTDMYETCRAFVGARSVGDQIVEVCGMALSSDFFPEIDGMELAADKRPNVYPGTVLEVRDLNDPRSDRARIVRGHIAAGVAHVIEGAPQAPPAEG